MSVETITQRFITDLDYEVADFEAAVWEEMHRPLPSTPPAGWAIGERSFFADLAARHHHLTGFMLTLTFSVISVVLVVCLGGIR